jgi:FtsH-binding integral membrane protein
MNSEKILSHQIPPPYTSSASTAASQKYSVDAYSPVEGPVDNNTSNVINESDPFLNVAHSDRQIRMAFVRKIYILLTLQLAVTAGISAVFYSVDSVRQWVQHNTWMLILTTVLSIVFLLALMYFRRRHPLNLSLLAMFTLCMAYTVGLATSFYSVIVVVEAFAITTGVFLALTAYTVWSKRDFSGWGPFLYATLWVVVLASFVHLLITVVFGVYSSVTDTVIAGVSALLFSAYIIYDTFMILNRLSPEDYIVGIVDLYLDIINLFLAILRLIGHASKNN